MLRHGDFAGIPRPVLFPVSCPLTHLSIHLQTAARNFRVSALSFNLRAHLLQSRRASDYPAVFDLLLAYYLSSNYHRFFVGINAQSPPRKHAEQPGQHKPWHFPSFSDIFNHGIAVATIPRLRKHSMPSSLAKAPCHTLGEMHKRNPAARCSRSSAYPARQRGQQGNPEQHLALPRKRTARSDLHGVDFKVVSARKHATLYSASSLCEDLCRRLCARFS